MLNKICSTAVHYDKATPRLFYLDHMRLFLILVIALHHSSAAYAWSYVPSWFIRDGLMFRDQFFDGVFLLADSFMLPAVFFLAGLFTAHSLGSRSGWECIAGRLKRLLIPAAFAVPILIPLVTYPGYKEIMAINPTWFGGEPVTSLFGFMVSPIFWTKMFAGAHIWFLVFLSILTVICVLLRQYCQTPYVRLTRCVAHAFEKNSVKPVFFFVAIMSVIVWGSDFLTGYRTWISTPWRGISGLLSVIGSQVLLNITMFVTGMLLTDAGFLKSKAFIDRVAAQVLPLGLMTFVCAVVYLSYTLGVPYETVIDESFVLFRAGGGHFIDGLYLIPGHFIVAFPRCFLFVCLSVLGTLFLLGLFYKKANVPLMGWKKTLPGSTMGIFLFHLPCVVWMQYCLKGVTIFPLLKMIMVFSVAVSASWVLSMLTFNTGYCCHLISTCFQRACRK